MKYERDNYGNSSGGDFPGVVFDAMMTPDTVDPIYVFALGAASSDLYSCDQFTENIKT